MNVIEFYYEDGKMIAKIHSKGKTRVVKNRDNLNKLLEITRKYGYKINKECYIEEDVPEIVLEYLTYLLDKQRKKNKLTVFGNITDNMKINKKLVALTLATTLTLSAVSSIPKYKEKIENDNKVYYDKQIDIDEEVIEEENDEIEEMLQEEGFHFSYEDRSSNKGITNAKRYEDLFIKYGNMYGVDYNLLMAIAAQESTGDHYSHIDTGPAQGIMQIEKSVHLGETITAYNFETGEKDSITIDKDKLDDLEYNIQIGTMIFRKYLENNNYNIPLTLQTYNFGPGNMDQALSMCSELEHIDKEKMKKDPTNNAWLRYRAFLNVGDPEYVEHVFSYLDTDTLSVRTKDNEEITIKIINDYQKDKEL